MRSIKRTSLPLLLILLGVFACVIPGTPQVDQNAAGTAVQQTLSAIIKQTEDAGQGIVDLSSDTPAPTPTAFPTFTPIPSSLTPTLVPTSTHTPTVVPSWTPTFPMISVSVATNCRLGPGKLYTLVGGLQPGQWVRVYARDPGSDYWYVRNPDKPQQFCWVWGEYATFIGPLAGLPVYTPPPSPTPTITSTPAPNFDVSYVSLQACSGKWRAEVKLKNTGTSTFRSISMTVKDTTNSRTNTLILDDFTSHSGCNSSIRDTLPPAKSTNVSLPAYAYNLTNHKMNATITLCTNTGLNGYCVTRQITFKP